jgi:SAM-dependent methyltransferase
MNKLNFGCGTRLSSNWTNIDFHSVDSRVKRVNLLAGFPFPDNHFDAVYSSHVLEHFTRDQGLFLLKESYRVLKPSGVVRIVVPDLEGSCREYISILDMPDSHPEKNEKYEWIMLELLDQLVRSTPSGGMKSFRNRIIKSGNEELIRYILSRTENERWIAPRVKPFMERLKDITPQKLVTKINYWYVKGIGRLIPSNLRSMVFVDTAIGERHRWMYDRYGLKLLFAEARFRNMTDLPYNVSSIENFDKDCLDSNPDGSSYKNNSIYCEAYK